MNILHTITCTTYCNHSQAFVEFTRSLIRSKRLTYKGAERILRRDGSISRDAAIVRIETAILSR